MGHPGPVEPVGGLPGLVRRHLGEGGPVDLGIPAARDERGHPAHGEGPAPVAGLDQQLGVGPHEGRGHGDVSAVDEHEIGPGVAEVLDDAEQVVPAARVQSGGVIAELEQDLLHLERGRDGLDQHGGADRPVRDAEPLLGVAEHLVPQPRLEMALQLRQVVVRPVAVVQQQLGQVVGMQPEVDQGPDAPPAVDQHVGLGQVPAARPHHHHRERDVGPQPVLLAVGLAELQRPAGPVAQVEQRVDHVPPGRAAGVLQVGQPDLGAGVERVDGHLGRRGRTGHLHPAVPQGRWGRCHLPVRPSAPRRSRAGSPAGRRRPPAPAVRDAPPAARPGGPRTAGAAPRRRPARPRSGSPPSAGRGSGRSARCSSGVSSPPWMALVGSASVPG